MTNDPSLAAGLIWTAQAVVFLVFLGILEVFASLVFFAVVWKGIGRKSSSFFSQAGYVKIDFSRYCVCRLLSPSRLPCLSGYYFLNGWKIALQFEKRDTK